ncbi:hypothetical protein BpHYR1_019822, partial [Brachionus plicatilis]
MYDMDVLQENVGFGLRETRIINFKVDDIPKLYGNDRDKVDEWIYLVETEARTQGIIKSRLIDCVTNLLRGNALQMLRNMQKRDESVTWEKFKNQLLATLKPADVQRGLRSELKSIKLTSNFEDNIMKFQTIANKIDKIDEFELVWFFLEALDPRVRGRVRDKPTVVNYSRQKNFNNKDYFMKPSINGKEYVSKFRGQKFNHNGKEKFRSQNELKKNLICFGCKKPGHKISQCRLNNNNYKQYRNTRRVNMIEEVNNDSVNRKENPEYVYTCDTGNLLYISATINGITLTIALDSGCTTSILSRKFVERNKITVKESDIRIKTADNNIVKVNGKTEALKLNIEGHVCEIEFLVIDHEDSDGLLGFDWFMRTGASLNPSERSLKFPSEQVYLDVSEKEYCNKVITENLTDENCPDD